MQIMTDNQNKKTFTLYEYDSLQNVPHEQDFDLFAFKDFLDEVWTNYKNSCHFWRDNLIDDNNDEDIKKKQQFFYFDDRNGKFKPKNFVGYIKFQDYEFILNPKICKSKTQNEINNILLWWLSYSDVYNFPNFDTSLTEHECDNFFECLIFLFAKYTSELFSTSLFQHYEEISEETTFLKGKLNFTEYIKNVVCGKSHKFYCTYDSFELNNKFNQIVKYVSKILLNISKNPDNQNMLSKIIFCLDEVDDVICTYDDCKSVYINRFLSDFETVLNYCKLFLQNCVTFNQSGSFETFAFLLKTDVLFEDFLTNYLKEKKSSEYRIKSQIYTELDENKNFYIKPDLLVYKNEKNEAPVKIIDIKYKIINSIKDISQADIYQVMTYATKLNCNNVILLYPKIYTENNDLESKIEPIVVNCCSNKITIHFDFIDCHYHENTDKDIENLLKK